jgi:hypothetical protein
VGEGRGVRQEKTNDTALQARPISRATIVTFDTLLEISRVALAVGIAVANIGVWKGVALEKDENPKETRDWGWRLLVRSLAAEAFLALSLVVVDTVLTIRQQAAIASLYDRASKAEQELVKIKEERRITPDQHGKLVACLRPGPKGPVYLRPGVLDTDGPKLAKQLEEIFKEVEFPLPTWPGGPAVMWTTAGWYIIVVDLNHAPFHATLIQKCFWEAGLPIYGQADPKHPADAVSIGIGPRL